MRRIGTPVYFYPLAAMLFWGFSFIWSSVLLRSYSPVTVIFARLIISALFLFALAWLTGRPVRIERHDRLLLLLSALFNPFLYFLGENYGLKFSSPTIAAVIVATIPVFSPVVGFLAFRERLTALNLAGIGISFGGVLMILLGPDLSLAADPVGVVCLFGAVAAALAYSATLRKLTDRYAPLTLVAWQNLIGIFLFMPLFLAFDLPEAFSVPLTTEILTALLFLSVLASSLAFVFFAQSVKLLGMSKSNIFSNLIPVFTATFSFFLLGEPFTLKKLAGMILVIGGVYLSEHNKKGS